MAAHDEHAPPQPQFSPLGPNDPREMAGYELRARIGSGGMGSVYLSYTRGGQPVALKVVRGEFADDPDFRRRFAAEVRAARRVQGLYTVPVLDSNTEGAAPWLATAYVPGLSLAEALRRHGPLPLETVLLLVAGVAEALTSIHAVGVVHRDLKPGNVLLATEGPKVIDFGIAQAADSTALTGTDVRVGTPAYMAPEQIMGNPPAGPGTDVFALGIIAHFAATGGHPFGEGGAHGLMYRIVQEDPYLARAPEALRPMIAACLAKNPAQRPGPEQVVEMCRSLSPGQTLQRRDSWLPAGLATQVSQRHGTQPPTPPPLPATAPTLPPPPAAKPRRTMAIALATTAVLAAVAGGAAAALLLTDGDDDTPRAGGPTSPSGEAPETETGTDTDPDTLPESGAGAGLPGESEEPGKEIPEQDPDAPYWLDKSDVRMNIRAPIFKENVTVTLGSCFGANLTRINLEELTVATGVGFGSSETYNEEAQIEYQFCGDERADGDGIVFDTDLFVGVTDSPDTTPEECSAAAHTATLPNPITIEDVLNDTSLSEDMGICIESPDRSVVHLWIDTVQPEPHNQELRTYLATATRWVPND
ncbi:MULTISPECIES: serine/threonine-protein kinase [unclassified Streptomyces]|uniref:serine/threonine-protein kinase n=1 Tax=unclassified Streptomyces TaxID=2593676 RepID=UPI001906899F|nr:MULTISPECIES: serine/threonine-protein kinase [unclassified Streptomyces]MCU4746952.1 serine/threonine protein kinase [Streptomyces sp. G-5]QQN77642.1 serine/threonine protein kinase [Streptomyces sp. XC 2026]